MPEDKVIIRNLTYQDIDGIIELQEKSFPSMFEEGSVWKDYHLKSHIDIFPEGQFCAIYKDKIIGSSSSLIVKLESEYEIHTFSQVTGIKLQSDLMRLRSGEEYPDHVFVQTTLKDSRIFVRKLPITGLSDWLLIFEEDLFMLAVKGQYEELEILG